MTDTLSVDLERTIRVVPRVGSETLSEELVSSFDLLPLRSEELFTSANAEAYQRLVANAPEMLRLLTWITESLEASSVRLPGGAVGHAMVVPASALVPLRTLIDRIKGT